MLSLLYMLIDHEYTKVRALGMWLFNTFDIIYTEYDCMKIVQNPETDWNRK